MSPLKTIAMAKDLSSYCDYQHILPVRYALTNESASPISGLPLYCDQLPDLGDEYKFTLRSLHRGYVFLTWKELGEIAVYEVKGPRFLRVSEVGPEVHDTIRLPLDCKQFSILYLRIPDIAKEYCSPEVKLWQLVAENIKKNIASMMQSVTLGEGRYDAPLSEFKNLIEEYRKQPGWLNYLPEWDENKKTFRVNGVPPLSDPKTPPEKKWHASFENEGAWRRQTENTFCGNTRLIALHDSIGNLLDCRSIQSKSAEEIAYFKRWNAPLLINSALIDTVILSMWEKKIKEWEDELKEKISQMQTYISQTNEYMEAEGIQRSERESEAILESWKENYIRRNPKPVPPQRTHNGDIYTPITNKNHDEYFVREYDSGIQLDFNKREKDLKKFGESLRSLEDSLKPLITPWMALLKCPKKYGFSWVLSKLFESTDQSDANVEALAEPLTLARGDIFAACHKGITEHAYFIEQLDATLFKDATYTSLMENVLGKGGIPNESFTMSLYILLPYLTHRLHKPNGVNDAQIGHVMKLTAGRLQLPSPAAVPASVSAGDALADLFGLTIGMREPSVGFWEEHASSLESATGFLNAASDELVDTLEASLSTEEKGLLKDLTELEATEKKAELAENKFTKRQRLLAERNAIRIADGKEPKVILGDGVYWNKLKNAAEKTRHRFEIQDTKAKTRQSKVTGYQSKILPAKALAACAGQLAAAASFLNVLILGKDLLKQLKNKENKKAAQTSVKILASAYPLAESAVLMHFKTVSKKVLLRMAVGGAVLGGIAALLDVVELWGKDDVDAAISATVIGAASVAGCFSVGIAAAFGVGVLPVALVIAVIGAIGIGIYVYCKDDDETEFLKNNPWAPNCTRIHTRLATGQITPGKDHPTVEEWKEAVEMLREYLSIFCAPQVSLGTNGDAAYVSIFISNLMGMNTWSITLDLTGKTSRIVEDYTHSFGSFPQNGPPIRLEHRHMIGDTQELFAAPQYLFEMLLDWKLLEQEAKTMSTPHFLDRLTMKLKCSMGGDYPLEDREFAVTPYFNRWVNKTERGEVALEKASE